ncbi:CDP-diacylglycerol-inositol 3-phosphatidyltransferase-like protein PIS [Xylogone sp. PMI_703]|nr:CDP-diacylglycerol-inositol 3-phosphatidyltransferase-like protein PIS [Xylogone sp. PMI_703]
MSSVKTRRQAALVSSPKTPKTPSPVSAADEAIMNGNGNGIVHGKSREDDHPQENIFLFIPNLIGYSRIILAIASLYYMPLHPRTCSLLYSISCLLDALDGYAARRYEQSTRFGAVLDMVTDRCTTSCLLVFLASAFPRWSIIFQGLISLDLASHYVHMYATLAMGGSEQSHKKVDKSRSFLLNLYYTNKARGPLHLTVLFICCALNEIFFLALYLLSFSSPYLTPSLLKAADAAKEAVGSAQPVHPAVSLFANPHSAAALELARANKMDSTIPWIIAGISFPVMAFKQIVNVIQLVKASQWLAEGDVEMRRAQGLPRKSKKQN